MDVSQTTLGELLARLAEISEELDDRQQRHHGLRASSRDHLDLSVQHAQIKAMKREQAELRRQILACEEWDRAARSGRTA